MDEKLTALETAIKAGKRKDALALTQELVQSSPPGGILNALISGMNDVGKRFKANEIFVPEVLVAARAMKGCLEVLEPKLAAAGLSPEHTIVMGTVEGDLHDIGKNLVVMLLKGANFNVIDLGVNVPPEKFYEAVKEHHANVLALSALLTTTMPAMKSTIEKMRGSDLKDIKVMVGGAPVTQAYADEIGADGYSMDAASAVELAKELVG